MSRPIEARTTSLPPRETTVGEKRIIVGLARDINFDDFARAVGGEVIKDGARFQDSHFEWDGSLSWQNTYEVPVPNPFFSEFVPTSRTVQGRNLRLSAHYWDGMPDSDGRGIDRQKFENAGFVLVIGKPEESFAVFLEQSAESDANLSGVLIAKGTVSNFGGIKDMFAPQIQEAASISRFQSGLRVVKDR